MFDATAQLRRIIRTEPVQPRGALRVSQLLDAAAAIIDESGIRSLTTTAVAVRAGASVGVLYRYFPNIHSLLLGLAGRNFERYVQRIAGEMPASAEQWRECATIALDGFVAMMREEPGFRALGIGHGLDAPAFDLEDTSQGMMAQVFAAMLKDRYGITAHPQLLFQLEVCVELSDGLVRRAFKNDPHGDERFLAVARSLVAEQMAAVSTEGVPARF